MSAHHRQFLLAAVVAIGCRERVAQHEHPGPGGGTRAAAAALTGNAPAPSPNQPGSAPILAPPASQRGSVPLLVLGPYLIDSVRYTVEMDRYVNDPDTAVRRIQVKDSTRRVVYDEDLVAMLHGDSTSWIELSAEPLEDASGRARAFELDYQFYPSAPSSGEGFMLVAPRGGVLRPLTPRIGYFGNREPMKSGAQAGSLKLLPGDRMVIKPWMYNYAAVVPVRVDLGCEPGAPSCVTVALPDSIAGLARFAVEAEPRVIDSAATIELYSAPGVAAPAHIQLVVGSRIEVLGGAGRVSFDRREGMDLVVVDDWLQVRVNGRTGWVHGAETYGALGLPSAG
jgi:hypothetical protein